MPHPTPELTLEDIRCIECVLCFVQFHFTDVEVFAGSGYSQSSHVGTLMPNSRFSQERTFIVYLILDTSWFAMPVAFSFLISSNISLLSRNKALNLEGQYFVLRLLCIERYMFYYALNRIGKFQNLN